MPSLALSATPAAQARGLIAVCLAATWFIWGSTYLGIKWALVSLPPFLQMGSRFVAAAAVLALWAAWRGARWPNRSQWLSASVLGALLVGGGYGFTAVAQTHVSSAMVVAFIAISPALIALGQWHYGVRPQKLEMAGIALGVAGVVLLVQGESFAAAPAGVAAQAFACVCWSLGSVWAIHGLPGGFKLEIAEGAAGWASQMMAGGLMLLAAGALMGERVAWPIDQRALLSWVYLVLAGTLLAYTAYMVLLQHVSAALASSYAFVNPVIGMVLGTTLGAELVSRGEWVAAGVITTGVLLILLAKRQPRPASSS